MPTRLELYKKAYTGAEAGMYVQIYEQKLNAQDVRQGNFIDGALIERFH